MGKIMLNEIDYSGGNANVIRLTQAEYDALPPTKLTDNNVYMITDANGDGSQFQPVIYSEDEREIGVWVDGKPLYQKTFLLSSSATLNKNSWTSVNVVIQNAENCLKCEIFLDQGDKSQWSAFGKFVNDTLQIFTTVLLSIEKVTIQYTKTTDTPGSGIWTPQGVPAVHYSTDEQVVGTWIDGSTVYEKTYSVNFTYESLTCDVAFSDISNLNSIIDLKGILGNAVLFTLNGVINNSNKLIITSLHQYGDYGYIGPEGIRIKRGDILWYGDTPSVIVTIRYTKSTT